VLTERLCAVCLMREAIYSQGRIAELTKKAQDILGGSGGGGSGKPHIPRQQPPAAAMDLAPSSLPKTAVIPVTNAPSQVGSPQLSHKILESMAPSQGSARVTAGASSAPTSQRRPPLPTGAVGGGSGAVAAAMSGPSRHESVQRILEQAKQVAKFSGLMRRSPLGFQAFIERADFRDSQPAKLASMHVAALSMDLGMADGFALISHASRARASIDALCR